jgi:hypothetical protein
VTDPAPRPLRDKALSGLLYLAAALFWVPIRYGLRADAEGVLSFDRGQLFVIYCGWVVLVAIIYIARTVGRIADKVGAEGSPKRSWYR